METSSIGIVTTPNSSVKYPEYYPTKFTETVSSYNDSGIFGPNDANGSLELYQQCLRVKSILTFDSLKLARVIIIWLLFLISLIGNLFVLSCVIKKARTSHIYLIMLHLTLADLAFTWFNMAQDAWWGITIMWKAGEVMCKLCQILRAFGIYISAYMVVVTAFDRCFSILSPMTTPSGQRRRTRILLIIAWGTSILCSIPAGVVFSLFNQKICPDIDNFTQCVDWQTLTHAQLRKYNFCFMFLTMVMPLIIVVISYSLVIWEISNMVKRDRAVMQRRNSNNSLTILRARKKTLILTSMVTSSFVLLWGPFYVLGIYAWFNTEYFRVNENKQLETAMFLLMYFHPAIHPFMYGAWVREVRDKFWKTLHTVETTFACGRTSETSTTPNQKPLLTNNTHALTNGVENKNGNVAEQTTYTRADNPNRHSCLSNNNSLKQRLGSNDKTVRWEQGHSRNEGVKINEN